jgi:predicted ArsR family transcriptional regulator
VCERRDQERRSEVQRRVVEWLCINPVGSTPAEVAAAADIPRSAARRILKRLAAKWLVRRNEMRRWAAADLLLSVPRLIREPV